MSPTPPIMIVRPLFPLGLETLAAAGALMVGAGFDVDACAGSVVNGDVAAAVGVEVDVAGVVDEGGGVGAVGECIGHLGEGYHFCWFSDNVCISYGGVLVWGRFL